ncbi:ClpP family protease [Anaerosporobacter faecicola]|uniref:ClpP family protease n=1 Tax=Anaerosporobacter faecicola TaxID=2718714 RepID=UPI001438F5B9
MLQNKQGNNKQNTANNNANMQSSQNDKSKVEVDEKTAKEIEKLDNDKVQEYGQVTLDKNRRDHKLHLMTIIGEIEGHECLSQQTKTTKYEHILPQLAVIEDSEDIEGVLFLINTIGGAVESGLAIAEMIASLSKPTVSLIVGDSHSIGVPLAVATDYSFIVPTGTVIIHPVRMSGTVIGSQQTYDYFKIMQDRIVGFIADHSKADREGIETMMFNTAMMSKDLGTILVGKEAVERGVIDTVGGIHEAIEKLYDMIEGKN